MIRAAAMLWLAVVAIATGYLGLRLMDGLAFRTDLMALLPREERDPALQRANDQVTDALSRRLVILIGHQNREAARAATQAVSHALGESALVTIDSSGFDKDRLRHMGELYFPYRQGLLSQADRQSLIDGRAQDIATRALSQIYGLIGMGDAGLVQRDPFLLLPSFFNGLPLPLSRLTPDDGLLSLQDDGKTWALIAGRIAASPYELEAQQRLTGLLDPLLASQSNAHPGLEVLRLGAVFYAKAGAEQAMSETSAIGIASLLGLIVLILAVFRALTPLFLSILAVGVGVICALSASLAIFGELHVAALLFGVTLIGIAVDYSLQYFSEVFATESAVPRDRLKRIMTGISLGAASVMIGYLSMLLAPFPGLHQIAVFSAVGLLASWLVVVLWVPALDRTAPARHGRPMLALADRLWTFWQAASYRPIRRGLIGLALLIAGLGAWHWHTDDDVRRMQSLDPALFAQQAQIQRLIGSGAGNQFILVQAADHEIALQRQEVLVERLRPLVANGDIAGFQAPAQYVPSAARQRDNRDLQRTRLGGALLQAHVAQLGLIDASMTPETDGPVLTLSDAIAAHGPLGFLSSFLLEGHDGGVLHIIMLDVVMNLRAVAAATDSLTDIRLIDPAGDFSLLLGKYRNRAVILLAISLALMAPLLIWRYGLRGGFRVLLPSLLAIILTPALRAALGSAFTFFDAMALVLVLSIGIDYAVFIAETTHQRRAVTLLAVALAAGTTLMSFGLLALSGVMAVKTFGATMAIGVLVAFILAPIAATAKAP